MTDDRTGPEHFAALHRHGFVRVAACTPRVRPADVSFNRDAILAEARRADAAGVDVAVFPELSRLGLRHRRPAPAGRAARRGRGRRRAASSEASADLAPRAAGRRAAAPRRPALQLRRSAIAAAGCSASCRRCFLPNYREYYEKRWFAPGRGVARRDDRGRAAARRPSARTCSSPPRTCPASSCTPRSARTSGRRSRPRPRAALAGATDPRQPLGLQHHHRQGGRAPAALPRRSPRAAVAAYVYSAAGPGESTTDLAWDGQGVIYEIGDLLAETERFPSDAADLAIADIDLERILRRADAHAAPSTTPPAAARQRPLPAHPLRPSAALRRRRPDPADPPLPLRAAEPARLSTRTATRPSTSRSRASRSGFEATRGIRTW